MDNKIICLGIESTAHTFGIGIVDSDGKVLANVKDLYTTDKGGLVPFDLTVHHYGCFERLLNEAFENSCINISDVNLIAFSQSPGIGAALRIGAAFARSLAIFLNIPLVGVHHSMAHLEVGMLRTGAKDPVFVNASGANTQIIAYEGGKYRIFGETLDMGVGNFIDAFARFLNMGFPGGPKVYDMALKSDNYIELPYLVKGMDVGFAGLLTNLRQKVESGKYEPEDLCYSAQENIFSMILEVAERAMAHCNKKELLFGGGVASNKRFQEMARIMTKERGAKFFVPEMEFLTDNGAMIAWTGIVSYKAGKFIDPSIAEIEPYKRIDEESVPWKD